MPFNFALKLVQKNIMSNIAGVHNTASLQHVDTQK